MYNFMIKIVDGNPNTTKIIENTLLEVEKEYELVIDNHSCIAVEEFYGADNCNDTKQIEGISKKLKKMLPNNAFTLDGWIDDDYSGFRIKKFFFEYNNGILVGKSSDWYIRIDADDYDDYECFYYDYEYYTKIKISEDQFEACKDGKYYIKEDGNGGIIRDIPFTSECKITENTHIKPQSNKKQNVQHRSKIKNDLVKFWSRCIKLWESEGVAEFLENEGFDMNILAEGLIDNYSDQEVFQKFGDLVYLLLNQFGNGDFESMEYELHASGVDQEVIDDILGW